MVVMWLGRRASAWLKMMKDIDAFMESEMFSYSSEGSPGMCDFVLVCKNMTRIARLTKNQS